jgi:hypothetical protein
MHDVSAKYVFRYERDRPIKSIEYSKPFTSDFRLRSQMAPGFLFYGITLPTLSFFLISQKEIG